MADPAKALQDTRLGARATWLLLALAVVPHLPVLGIGFLHDDLFNYLHAFRFDGVGQALARAWIPESGGMYHRPLTESSFALDYLLFGMRPLGYRLTDLALHALAVWLAARVVLRLTGVRTAALVSAAVLAVHPLPGRALCWTSDRYVVLATVCAFAAILAFLRWRRSGAGRWLLLAVVGHALGLLAKESAAALPFALLVVDAVWGAGRGSARLRTRIGRIALGALPFVAVNVGFLALRWWAFGDLGGYRDAEDGSIILPFGPARMAKEALVDVPVGALFPINGMLLSGWVRVAVMVLLAAGWIAAAVLAWCHRRDTAGSGRLRHAVGGLLLGYALLLPSVPYFHLGRDLLKAYHLYPVALGFGLAAWALFASRRARPVFVALLLLWAGLGVVHAGGWIRITREVDAFGRWARTLDPPLDATKPLWLAGVPQRLDGALGVEANLMGKSLEVLVDRRLGPVQGLGYPWCRTSAQALRDSVAAGARLLIWRPVVRVGRDGGDAARARLARRLPPRDLVAAGRAVTGALDLQARDDAGRRWTAWAGGPVATRDYLAVELRLKLTGGGPPGAGAVPVTLRWNRQHFSAEGHSRAVRFALPADGVEHTIRIDLARTAWIAEDLAVSRLALRCTRTDVDLELQQLTLIPW